MLASTSISEAGVGRSEISQQLFKKALSGGLSSISHQGLRDAQPSSGSGMEA